MEALAPQLSERFEIIRQIGKGGMGIVYEALDRERGHKVALKALRKPDSDTIYRLKREFRALADISHHNLISLFDLFVDGDNCFFTMELVHGIDLIAYCSAQVSEDDGTSETLDGLPMPSDEEKLRAVLPQVATGLHALHTAGKIHRDVKPSNILVTRSGRAVVLDFGLVSDAALVDDGPNSQDGKVVGTASFMSPEQAAGERVTAAADWYSFGVLLYQALTGKLPFAGPTMRVIMDKQTKTAPAPMSIVPSVPTDLNDLCNDLLAKRPKKRPSGVAVLRWLGVDELPSTTGSQHSMSMSTPFSGRAKELAQLRSAFNDVTRAGARLVLVEGDSGIGKSALVREFLKRLDRSEHKLVVLHGRCYERENVPYKAVDSLIDELSNYWRKLPSKQAAALLPRQASLLPRLFPVLGRVPAIAGAPRSREPAEPQELRSRAFRSLRETLQRLADRQPLVLALDDLQWVDGDTIALLADLMRPPDPPQVFLLLSSRVIDDDSIVGQRVAELIRGLDHLAERIVLQPLSRLESLELAKSILGRDEEQVAERIADEAQGSPFFIAELIHYVQTVESAKLDTMSLDEVVQARAATLPEQSRHVLELLALAGEPIQRNVLRSASQLEPDVLNQEVRLLRTIRLVHAAGSRGTDLVQPYHDRVREPIAAMVSEDDRERHHRNLALALEEWREGSAGTLARHWAGAGDTQRALSHATEGARAAWERLEFAQAASFYEQALELGNHKPEQQRELRTRLGHALACAGRPSDAADSFELAAAEAAPAERLELHRQTAEQLVAGGYMKRGQAAIERVLSYIGTRLAPSPRRALVSLLWRRLRVRLRGMKFRERSESDIPRSKLTRADVYWSVATSLATIDNVRGGDYSARNLLYCLRLGEPTRVARALGLEAGYAASMGPVSRANRLIASATTLARQSNDAYTVAIVTTLSGMIELMANNDYHRALETLDVAEQLLRGLREPVMWELDQAQLFACYSVLWLGYMRELRKRVHTYLTEATRRGDRYLTTCLRTRHGVIWLADDNPKRAAAESADALATWEVPGSGYQLQHYYARVSRKENMLYTGNLDGAQEILDQIKLLRKAYILRIPILRMEDASFRGRLLIALAQQSGPGSDADQRLKEASAMAGVLAKGSIPSSHVLGLELEAQIELVRGNLKPAETKLRQAVLKLDEMSMNLRAAATRHRLGTLIGGSEGDELISQTAGWMEREQIANPPRMIAMLCPGKLATWDY